MIERLLLKLRARDTISAAEEETLRGLVEGSEIIPPRTTAIRRGEMLQRSVLLLEGLMYRYKDLKSGRRQVSAVHIPGDFLDLHGFTLKYLDHDVATFSQSTVAYVPHERLLRLTREQPHLTRLFWFMTNLDAAMHREWELSLGLRSGPSRAAHLFCELHTRLNLVGLLESDRFELPINQSELGECLGLTGIHTNRVLRQLREQGLAQFNNGTVVIYDLEGLKALAEFDPLYLYLELASH